MAERLVDPRRRRGPRQPRAGGDRGGRRRARRASCWSSRGEAIGRATNNVAEYKALLLGIELARKLGASEIELVGDSELVVRQVKGEYRVKDADLQPLHRAVREALEGFERWSIRHVRREQNAEADALVNETLDR